MQHRLALSVLAALTLLYLANAALAKTTYIPCTNTTTDAATINTIIAASTVGDTIVFQGTCLLTAPVKLLGDRSYAGESLTGTILRQANEANLNALLASDTYLDNATWTGGPISIRQLTLDGNKANNTAATVGIALRSWMSLVQGVTISNMGGHGILVTNSSANATEMTTSSVNGRIVGNSIGDCDGNGIYVRDTANAVTDWYLTDNYVANSGLDSIHMENAAGWFVERNHLYGSPRNAIYADKAYATTISDNYIEGFGEGTTAGTWYGIAVTLQGASPSTIANNRILNLHNRSNASSDYVFLGIIGVNYGDGLADVVGNTILGPGLGPGPSHNTGLLYLKGDGASLTVTSTGNLVSGVATPKSAPDGAVVNTGL